MALWIRFSRDGREGFGTLQDDSIAVHAGDLFAAPAPTGEVIAREDVLLLSPVRPRVFIGLWNNFREAAAKQGLAHPEVPLFFLKSPGSVVGPDAPIPVPAG